jgi:hypothetical protein
MTCVQIGVCSDIVRAKKKNIRPGRILNSHHRYRHHHYRHYRHHHYRRHRRYRYHRYLYHHHCYQHRVQRRFAFMSVKQLSIEWNAMAKAR